MDLMRMRFYACRNSDGTIHVTNAVGGYIGQHHVHDGESWEQWKAGEPEAGIGPVRESDIEWQEDVKDCNCGQPIWRRK